MGKQRVFFVSKASVKFYFSVLGEETSKNSLVMKSVSQSMSIFMPVTMQCR